MTLNKLPVELIQAIAQLAAPATACELQILDSNRRRFLTSLATLSRSMQYALRPMIWERVWIFPRTVGRFVRAMKHGPHCAVCIKELVCVGLDANLFRLLSQTFPLLGNVRAVSLHGPALSSAEWQPIRIAGLKRFPHLKCLILERCTVSDHIGDLPNLQTLAISGSVMVVDSDKRGAPAAVRPIASLPEQTRHGSVIRLEEQSFSIVYASGFVRSFSPQPAFESATRIELDASSYCAAVEVDDRSALRALKALVVLRCPLEHIPVAINPDNPFPPRLAVWIESDFRLPRAHETHPDVIVEPPAWLEEIEPICVALIQVAAVLESLTLPLNLGIELDEDVLYTREELQEMLYAVLKRCRASNVPVWFHNEPTTKGHTLDSEFTTLAEFDGDGCFSNLVAGRISDPDLRGYQVVVI